MVQAIVAFGEIMGIYISIGACSFRSHRLNGSFGHRPNKECNSGHQAVRYWE
ncbi:hypothetical protein BDV37DRAFT_241481 [Aspergillus pseudonomiae]|uniref:Uncharacterized protein n=1 Tax=Aspergillus pseudonomiae TaxID=1506151 RepID=A0A5N7DP96_9EURO|nr:uncharacterized protein BDV37DRAFT_241481 [Aspergillus pseudonomiae]KAE8407298.1 hypothetical protein BDV37DRAFT_241481 [Aspergillus pseudonomiae]